MPCADPLKGVYTDLRRAWPESAWLQALCDLAEQRLEQHEHGDLPRWKSALEALPVLAVSMQADQPAPRLGADAPDQQSLAAALMQLHPWRKGPLCLGGCPIDTEWRSDWKWDRLAGQVQWQDARVLDIGSGNGYFGWRMLAAGARLVVGVDPTLLFVMQWLACRHFAGPQPNFVLPLGIEDLPGLDEGTHISNGSLPTGPATKHLAEYERADLHIVCSMGVLYHRRDHLEHLRQLRQLLRPGGQLVLETLVLPSHQSHEVLLPRERYARMRNVWAVPGTAVLQQWVEEAGFHTIRLVDVTPTTTEEQRSTDWMRFESLAESLADRPPGKHAEKNPGRTLEGYPAPVRAIITALV